jgi:L-ribulose-5-phosphate 3-epimerase
MGAAANVRAAARPTPALCLFSQAMAEIEYSYLGQMVKQIGFDGVDLTIRPGGHVEPRLSNVDLVRAVESMTGPGLEVPIITTALISPYDPTMLPVLAIAGHTSVPLFRPGNWRAENPAFLRDIAGLAATGGRYKIAMALHNYTGEDEGEAPWEVNAALAELDPHWVGVFFDPIHARERWEPMLKSALPRLRAVALKDFTMTQGKAAPCPMGQGTVDWPRFFGILAQAKFFGPLSLRVDYAPKDMVGAITKDHDFARKQMEAAYVRMGSGSGAGSGSGPGWGRGTGSGGANSRR